MSAELIYEAPGFESAVNRWAREVTAAHVAAYLEHVWEDNLDPERAHTTLTFAFGIPAPVEEVEEWVYARDHAYRAESDPDEYFYAYNDTGRADDRLEWSLGRADVMRADMATALQRILG